MKVVGLVAVLLVVVSSTAGCFAPSPGPLQAHFDDPVFTDLRHFNFTVRYHNPSDKPVDHILTSLDFTVWYANGTVRPPGENNPLVYSPTIDNEGGWWGYFNRTDVIPPGGWRNLTLHVYCDPRQCEVESGDVLQLHFRVSYQDDATRWVWSTGACWDTSGEAVHAPMCRQNKRVLGPFEPCSGVTRRSCD